jgi:Protein of unknown function (DUF664)
MRGRCGLLPEFSSEEDVPTTPLCPVCWTSIGTGAVTTHVCGYAGGMAEATFATAINDGLSRVVDLVHDTLDSADQQLAYRITPQTNTIAWLIWHLTRIQDDHLAGAYDAEQVWLRDGWADRFNLPFDKTATGYGQSADDVAALDAATVDLLVGYHDAVYAATCDHLSGDTDFDRIVDDSFDPPVTLATRLVSVLSDDLQHIGQAALIKGVAVSR